MAKAAESLQKMAGLIEKIEGMGDEKTRQPLREILHALMAFHAEALEEMLDQIAGSDLCGVPLIDAVGANPGVAPLLLLYNLHPLELEARVGQALEKARPYLHSHGGDVELLRIEEGHVFLRLHGSCHGCPSSAITLKQTLEEALNEFAPDAAGVHVEQEEGATDGVAVTDGATDGVAVTDGAAAVAVDGHFSLPILAAT